MYSCAHCDPMGYSPTASSIHGISQARIPEWVAISYSRKSSRPRDQTLCLLHLLHWQGILYHCSTWESQELFYLFMLKIENLFKDCWWILVLYCFLDHCIKMFQEQATSLRVAGLSHQNLNWWEWKEWSSSYLKHTLPLLMQ